ncbi:transcriptional regulator [Sutterella sp.]|uniref:helix-turn-helix transcriptional regulator n=1 Tax=Sutterella sp. TaxID=1981025 RepID=UPI0026E109E9|nr:PAS domain-containing protein [Sutterella sp.]MDO5530781.1 PAS domain-containing protein [Sutterella sp.]
MTASSKAKATPRETAQAALFAPWRAVAELVARVGGPDCETVLHDLSDPVHSVIYVVNGHVTGRAPGQGFRHLVAEMLRDAAANPEGRDLLNDWWFRHEGRLIRSMTLLIRGASGELAGALCVNHDVSAGEAAFRTLKQLLPGLSSVSPVFSSEEGVVTVPAAPAREVAAAPQTDGAFIAPRESVPDAVFRLIDRIVADADAKENRGEAPRSREARLALIAFMEERGVFLVKGAIERAALRLGVSKVTVYSDLDQLRRDKPGQEGSKVTKPARKRPGDEKPNKSTKKDH